MIRNNLPQFQDDYIISWDSSEKGDFNCVQVVKLRKDGPNVTAEVVGHSYASCGCISLRQVLEEHERRQREQAERMKDAERLRKTFIEEGETDQ